jgi:hypothetical protein
MGHQIPLAGDHAAPGGFSTKAYKRFVIIDMPY